MNYKHRYHFQLQNMPAIQNWLIFWHSSIITLCQFCPRRLVWVRSRDILEDGFFRLMYVCTTFVLCVLPCVNRFYQIVAVYSRQSTVKVGLGKSCCPDEQADVKFATVSEKIFPPCQFCGKWIRENTQSWYSVPFPPSHTTRNRILV